MVIRVLSTQIPQFWEAIKQSVTQADEVEIQNRQIYLNELLHALLNDKAQCWVRLNEERRLLALIITRIQIDKITGNKNLFGQAIYSWEKLVDKEQWQDEYNFIKEFARREQCKRITFESANDRIWQIAKSVGFRESLRIFVFDL